MRPWFLALLPLYVLLVAPIARAQDANDANAMAQAKKHFEDGRGAYLAGDYPRAVQEFQAAQALRASPILDYNIGLAYEGMGDAPRAIDSYQRYLAQKPDAQNRADVEGRMGVLQQQMAAQQQQQPQQQQPPPGYPGPGAQAQPPQGQSTYDPYGNTYYPPAVPYTPPKKKSRAWIAPVVIGAVVVTLAVIVIVAVAASSRSNDQPYIYGSLTSLPQSQAGIPAQSPALLRF